MASTSNSYRERVVSIGPDENLVGIATDPNGAISGSELSRIERPLVMFLNAGVLHRVGPHRLHVSLARRLAEQGFRCLRIDLSGIGDSRPLPDSLTFRESSVADTRAAMDHVSATSGAAKFIIFGLCSGADNALATAAADTRVMGLILLDGPAYTTIRSSLRKILQRSRQAGGLAAFAGWLFKVGRRRILGAGTLMKKQLQPGKSTQATPAGRVAPPRYELGAQLTALADRGTQILCIYSGANDTGYNHPGQFFEWFPALRDRLQVEFFPRANHVFTELSARAALMDTVCRWCADRSR